jgi:hypothetical protein
MSVMSFSLGEGPASCGWAAGSVVDSGSTPVLGPRRGNGAAVSLPRGNDAGVSFERSPVPEAPSAPDTTAESAPDTESEFDADADSEATPAATAAPSAERSELGRRTRRRRRGILCRDRLLGFVAHSGGSSSKTRFQIAAAARVATRLERAPTPASRPDHIRRLTKGLSFIDGIQPDSSLGARLSFASRPPQIISTISFLTCSNSSKLTGRPLKIHCVSTCSIRP